MPNNKPKKDGLGDKHPIHPLSSSISLTDFDTHADALIFICKDMRKFRSEMEEPCAEVMIDGHTQIMKMDSSKFKLFLSKISYDTFNKLIGPDSIQQVITHFKSIAAFEGATEELSRRVGRLHGNIYYDLTNDAWEVVEINNKGFKILSKSPIPFFRSKNMRGQVTPDPNGSLLKLIKRHFRFKRTSDCILFTVYLVSCFIPNIPHPLLVLAGEHGAAKSTTMSMLRAIVDPAKNDLLSMPNGHDDLILALLNNYMPSFDNLDMISSEKSNILCMASTGGSFSKRALYTNDDEIIMSLRRCVTLNGINVVVSRPDLLDRSLISELGRISETERRSEEDVWSSFYEDLPQLVGACLNTLSKAMGIYPTVQLTSLPRMADFATWGFAIAEALGIGGTQFLEAYKKNQLRSNEEVLSTHPVAMTVLRFMKNKSKWKGDWTTLLAELENQALKMNIRTHQKSWPAAAHALSRRMNTIKSNLEQAGIYFDTRQGDTKELILENRILKTNSFTPAKKVIIPHGKHRAERV
ncbi:hypothetical protein SAMN03159341_12258 [Paenibacillus sp. 1_12]|uniref:hypothetical protein n=1 Tax=Paenibacillus sp. 1_12 TaxID=1566278 RepID=UPI0008ECCC53|nr:hypothetical protein [Paenibacillus sp. 1_12]SFM25253.1 hypothetical protein SAMN03159341_12258 [Paenibacillus sp. 1_12]